MYVSSAKSLQIPFHTFKTPYIMQIPTPSYFRGDNYRKMVKLEGNGE